MTKMKLRITDAMYATSTVHTISGTVSAMKWMESECDRLGDAWIERYTEHHGYPMYAVYREFTPNAQLAKNLAEYAASSRKKSIDARKLEEAEA